MHLKVFLKLKNPKISLFWVKNPQKNPKKPQKTPKNPKKPKKPQKNKKSKKPTGLVFF
jgi:hypothetical protein